MPKGLKKSPARLPVYVGTGFAYLFWLHPVWSMNKISSQRESLLGKSVMPLSMFMTLLVAASQRNRVEWVERKKHLLHEQIKLDDSLFCNTSLNPTTVLSLLILAHRTSWCWQRFMEGSELITLLATNAGRRRSLQVCRFFQSSKLHVLVWWSGHFHKHV